LGILVCQQCATFTEFFFSGTVIKTHQLYHDEIHTCQRFSMQPNTLISPGQKGDERRVGFCLPIKKSLVDSSNQAEIQNSFEFQISRSSPISSSSSSSSSSSGRAL
jgi:hypothetical protein